MSEQEPEAEAVVEEEGGSEFGRGFCYCLGLFLAHERRLRELTEVFERAGLQPDSAIPMWFNGAADHMFEFDPSAAPTAELRDRAGFLQSRCLVWRLPMREEDQPSMKDYDWAIQEAKDLLRLTDEAHGVKTEKGRWE